MLINTNHVIGLPIFSVDMGKNIHKVEDVVFDPAEQRIQALIVDQGGLFSEGRAINIDDVKSIGEDAVVIESESVLKKISELDASTKRIASEDNYLTKSTVITEDGKNLGKIVDLHFDSNTGEVIEFEVSQGGMRDMQSGRKRIRPEHIVTVGVDALIVSTYTAVDVSAQAEEGGMQGTFNQIKQSAKNAVDTIQDKWESPETQSRLAEAKANASEKLEAGKQQMQSTVEQTQQKMDQAKNDPDNQRKLEDLKAKASQTAEEVKDKAKQTAGATSEKIEEQQANQQQQKETNAVGQYITRNVLDQQDHLIARRGEMVTHSILDQAKEAGALDNVLQSLAAQPPASSYAGALGGEVERDEEIDENPPQQPRKL